MLTISPQELLEYDIYSNNLYELKKHLPIKIGERIIEKEDEFDEFFSKK